ncbi:unnamed protein product [Spirodela intermedia]|uniref:Uncharacterized protein n=1 Tax=Spirodela intermedia TaxID=51605 RepID=A0A7I8IW66_SPIIN|nr:unnamed protein product [Spirodela intermedia]CAA6661823.1 unnamed protein product [Spirodela intermedia]
MKRNLVLRSLRRPLGRLLPLPLLLLFLSICSAVAGSYVIVITKDDLKDPTTAPSDGGKPSGDSAEWEEFGDPEAQSEDELDPGSWRPIFEASDATSNSNSSSADDSHDFPYLSSIRKVLFAVSSGDMVAMEEAVNDIEAAATSGCPHAQSTLGFFYGAGIMRPHSRPKAFLYHQFAADGGNMQSKMVLAHTYLRQEMYEKAVKLYEELAEAAVAGFLISTTSPVLEPVRIHYGAEENKRGLRKSRGEEDDDFHIIEFQAQKGSVLAMLRIGNLYYFGLRGVRRNNSNALYWFTRAAEKGEPESMELLGEIYARGAGWRKITQEQWNGLYVQPGWDIFQHITAKEYFQKASDNKVAGGHYNLGVLYLRGIGVERNVTLACQYLLLAANGGQPKALYQVAKMFQMDIGFKRNLIMATLIYKIVAEMGPWSSLSRWATESYVTGDVGKALLLYLRMAELGYEVGQSNGAWILDKYGEHSMCIGESGFCTDEERHLRANSLWWQASEEGNEHAALLIGDAYYYGRGTEKDYERAAEAYRHAQHQINPQAMFNLGYMYEHGLGLPFDPHLAKRYYDQAAEVDPAAKLPVAFALASLWIRKNYAGSFLVNAIDSLPEVFPQMEAWVEEVVLDEANGTILTLFVCLLTVLYLRERQRRQAAATFAAAAAVAAPEQVDLEPIEPIEPN